MNGNRATEISVLQTFIMFTARSAEDTPCFQWLKLTERHGTEKTERFIRSMENRFLTPTNRHKRDYQVTRGI